MLKVTKLNPVINQVFRTIVLRKNGRRRKTNFSIKTTINAKNILTNNKNLPNFLDFFKNYSKRTKFLKKVFRFPTTN